MIFSKRTAFIAVIFFSVCFGDEVSVFEAGQVDNNTPYSLTESEKVVFQNSQKVDNLGISVNAEIGILQEQVEGVRSVLEGSNERINRLETRILKLEKQNNSIDDNKSLSQSSEIKEIKKYVEESREIEEKNYKKIESILAELSALIDSINTNYVSKKDLEDYLKNQKISSKKEDNKKFQDNPKELMDAALEDFKNKNYEDSDEKFKHLVKISHRPAMSNYYLGEISYNKKDWKTAISYYQKSIGLYDKANYIPRLLYHTAISFDKLGETGKANQFYRVLKADYPDTKEAKASPDRQ